MSDLKDKTPELIQRLRQAGESVTAVEDTIADLLGGQIHAGERKALNKAHKQCMDGVRAIHLAVAQLKSLGHSAIE